MVGSAGCNLLWAAQNETFENVWFDTIFYNLTYIMCWNKTILLIVLKLEIENALFSQRGAIAECTLYVLSLSRIINQI